MRNALRINFIEKCIFVMVLCLPLQHHTKKTKYYYLQFIFLVTRVSKHFMPLAWESRWLLFMKETQRVA